MTNKLEGMSGVSNALEPRIHVGIMDGVPEVRGLLAGKFTINGSDVPSGRFTAKVSSGLITLSDEDGREVVGAHQVTLTAHEDASFTLSKVTIGNSFHWERKEDQTFRGDLLLVPYQEDKIVVINHVQLEDYLDSVISSEMSANSPFQFLVAHAILSRSWLLAALKRKRTSGPCFRNRKGTDSTDETTYWYEQEDHNLYDVCADDHCQRYQGITKIVSSQAVQAVRETRGKVLTYNGEICDARFSKSCGGITEEFATAWETKDIPYLRSVSDGEASYEPVRTEEDALRWINSEPHAYCNTVDEQLIKSILPGFDRETRTWFRWKLEYTPNELESILREKSGIDFGTLHAINPLARGRSGRVYRLEIVGSNRKMIIGKELEIRRWLSPSHLYSSAFVVTTQSDGAGNVRKFIFHGAGWGHGVGLCQIGAAVMASKGFSADVILKHYFPGTVVAKIY